MFKRFQLIPDTSKTNKEQSEIKLLKMKFYFIVLV